MILKGEKKRNPIAFSPFLLILLILVILFSVRIYDQYSENLKTRPEFYFKCGMENIKRGMIDASGIALDSSKYRIRKDAFSGRYSYLLNQKRKRALRYVFYNVTAGDRYRVTAWTKNPHPADVWIVASAADSNLFYKKSNEIEQRSEDYWDKRHLSFQVPMSMQGDSIVIYFEKDDGPNEVYVDELEIRQLERLEPGLGDTGFEAKFLDLYIDNQGLDYLEEVKKKSISQGVIYHGGKDIEVRISDQSKPKMASLRIKGDWLDHISSFPSYRIEMNATESWLGMQSFSVQEPMTRGMLRNWVFAKVMEHIDILHPRTDFILMKQNNNDRFVFSFEEHFTKNLLESQERREGPILKFEETRLWDITKRHIKYFNGQLPELEEKEKSYWASGITAFKEKKTLNNPVLQEQYEQAQNLMLQYKYGLAKPKDIFDLDRMARYLAMTDICLAHHAITWHNQRFYYNPVTAVLEPIGFDAYSHEDPDNYASAIWSEEVYAKNKNTYEPLEKLFEDDDFIFLYFRYLYMYSKPGFIGRILDELEEGIALREQFLRTRFEGYSYDRKEILNKAKRIQRNFIPHEDALEVYRHSISGLQCINRHSFPLVIYGASRQDSLIVLPGNPAIPSSYYTLDKGFDLAKINYAVPGLDSLFTAGVVNMPVPGSKVTRQDILADNTSWPDEVISRNDSIILPKAKINIDKPLVFPAGKKIVVRGGAHITFSNNGMILSYSSLDMKGTEKEPIIVKSVDGVSGSISVINSRDKSNWSYTVLGGMNTLDVNGWNLTGAVSFYESDVDMQYVQFDGNVCEDALNIIKSRFKLEACTFRDTYGDAFDADFCTGEIVNSTFINCGNDGLDFSRSKIEGRNISISVAGDKGVSVGEESTVSLDSIWVENAVIGIASKDRSVVYAKNIEIESAETAFAAYQKKPEFGPSTFILGAYQVADVKREFMIEENSILQHVYQ